MEQNHSIYFSSFESSLQVCQHPFLVLKYVYGDNFDILDFAIFISHQVFKEACNSSWALADLNGSLFVQKYHSIFLYKTQENSDI